MITANNFRELLTTLGFSGNNSVLEKQFPDIDALLKVDFGQEQIVYPEEKGLIVNNRTICNFSANENFVVPIPPLETQETIVEKSKSTNTPSAKPGRR